MDLAIRCCRFAFAGDEPPLPLNAEFDWSRFLRLVRFHRVQGLAWAALCSNRDRLPTDVAGALAADAAAIAAENLRATVDCRNLLEDFQRAAIPLLFVKGLTLGVLAYGSPSIKAAVDIDLLVADGHVVEAGRVLENRGYSLQIPRGPFCPNGLRAWHSKRKESVWTRRDPRSQIDLHTRLSDNPALIPSLDVHSPRQAVEVAPGISMPTLADEELVAYLSVHGASSAWFRLKWISDFAALLAHREPGRLEQLYRRLQELGAGHAADQALLLADAFFQLLEANPELRVSLQRNSASRWLCRAAAWQLAGRPEPIEPTSRPLGTAMIHLTQFALLPGVRFKVSELVRQLRSAL